MKAVFLQRRPLTHGLAAGLLLAAFGGLALCAFGLGVLAIVVQLLAALLKHAGV